jgi:hypothetical protein
MARSAYALWQYFYYKRRDRVAGAAIHDVAVVLGHCSVKN